MCLDTHSQSEELSTPYPNFRIIPSQLRLPETLNILSMITWHQNLGLFFRMENGTSFRTLCKLISQYERWLQEVAHGEARVRMEVEMAYPAQQEVRHSIARVLGDGSAQMRASQGRRPHPCHERDGLPVLPLPQHVVYPWRALQAVRPGALGAQLLCDGRGQLHHRQHHGGNGGYGAPI